MGRALPWVFLWACGARTELTTSVVTPSDASSPDVIQHDSSAIDVVAPPDVAPKPLCSAGPTLLAPTTLAASQITLDDTTVFFGGYEGIYSVPKNGGTVTAYVAPKSNGLFVVRTTDVVWKTADIDSTYLWSMPKGGGTKSAIITEPAIFDDFALAPSDDLYIYGSDITNNQLLLFAPPSTVTPVTKLPLDTSEIKDEDGTTYTASLGGVFALQPPDKVKLIAKGPLGNGTLAFAVHMTFDATTVYFESVTDYHQADLLSAPKDGSGPVVVLAEGQDYNPSFSDLVLDGTHLYYADAFVKPQSSDLVRMALDGSDRTVLVTDPNGIVKVAVDATSIYWSSRDGIYCQAK